MLVFLFTNATVHVDHLSIGFPHIELMGTQHYHKTSHTKFPPNLLQKSYLQYVFLLQILCSKNLANTQTLFLTVANLSGTA